MAVSKFAILTLPVIATAAFDEHLAVGYDGELAAAGGAMFGIGTTQATPGEALAVDVVGTTEATAGGALAEGDGLEVGANGRLVLHNAGLLVARVAPGSSSQAAGDKIEVMLLGA